MLTQFYTNSRVHFTSYIQGGCLMLIFCLILLCGFVLEFERPVQETHAYHKDICLMARKQMLKIKFNCWNKDSVHTRDMPCVKVLVHTKNYRNIIFYRNIDEKLFAHKYNCSFLPTACQNNFNYMNEYLGKRLEHYFPKKDEFFECYTRNIDGKVDAIFYLPNRIAYGVSLFLSIFGMLTGLGMTLYGISFVLLTNKKYYKLSEYTCGNKDLKDNMIIEKQADYKVFIKRALDQAHINNAELVGVCSYGEDGGVACSSAEEIRSLNGCPSKLKLADSNEIFVGRIMSLEGSLKRNSSLDFCNENEVLENRKKLSVPKESCSNSE